MDYNNDSDFGLDHTKHRLNSQKKLIGSEAAAHPPTDLLKELKGLIVDRLDAILARAKDTNTKETGK
jgi:hypothetical protein